MEIVLAIMVMTAVIFFGALISMGNERQRKAIDDLREQTMLWAMQDLRIKRERLARDVQSPDPLIWLNSIAAKVCGCDLNMQIIEAFDEPRSLACTCGDGTSKIVFTPLSPVDLRNIRSNKHNRLVQFAGHNPLLSLPRDVKVFEISMLNGGLLFDIELPLVWKSLTGHTLVGRDRLWAFMY
ncbi:MAG TPA: hypothetical protein PKC99_00185 [Anaerolineales bacterium]|nr:hypothetical protein [Anaerolineales bacterium]